MGLFEEIDDDFIENEVEWSLFIEGGKKGEVYDSLSDALSSGAKEIRGEFMAGFDLDNYGYRIEYSSTLSLEDDNTWSCDACYEVELEEDTEPLDGRENEFKKFVKKHGKEIAAPSDIVDDILRSINIDSSLDFSANFENVKAEDVKRTILSKFDYGDTYMYLTFMGIIKLIETEPPDCPEGSIKNCVENYRLIKDLDLTDTVCIFPENEIEFVNYLAKKGVSGCININHHAFGYSAKPIYIYRDRAIYLSGARGGTELKFKLKHKW